jgi:signal transduction histidine kinase
VYPKKLLRSSAFRFALGYVALFGVSAVMLLAFIYWSTASYMQQQADETIEAEIVGLDERYRLTGLGGLTASIRERLGRRPVGSSIYLLADGLYTPIVGNLDRWPAGEPDSEGWIRFELNVMPNEPKHEVRAKPFALPGGFYLLVGRDMYELQTMRTRLVRTLSWGLALTVGLALAGGLVMSRSRIRRIAMINDAIGGVMAGDLSRRIPTESRGGDVEELVTKLNRMLDELEHLVEGVRRVSDSIAHDLRTPLARLKTRLERLRQTGVGEEADLAVEEADKLLATFAALLRIARIESGESRSQFTAVDLTALTDDVAELYRPLIEEQGKKFVIHNAPGISVLGDRDMLFQAAANLLDNALKHTPPEGHIELSLGKTNGRVEIIVADDGEGIPAEEHDKVVGRFYRLDRSRSTPGAGLGLSLVAAVVGLHHGRLRFEDNDPGLRVVVELQRPQSP